MDKKIILGVALTLSVLVVIGYIVFSSNTQDNYGGQSAGQASDPNYFAGNVTTKGVPAGTYNGTGVYDHNCLPLGNGMYSCDAGIQTKSFGIIDFAYKHNMMMKPCIGPGDVLAITVLDGSGAATVSRLSHPSAST